MYWIYSESSIIKTIVSKNHAINLQVNSQFLNFFSRIMVIEDTFTL